MRNLAEWVAWYGRSLSHYRVLAFIDYLHGWIRQLLKWSVHRRGCLGWRHELGLWCPNVIGLLGVQSLVELLKVVVQYACSVFSGVVS